MVYIGVNPVAFTIGSYSLRWYAVMVLLAIVFLVWWSAYFAQKKGYDKDFILGAALWAVPLGVIGAKLVHVVDDLSYIQNLTSYI